MHTHHKGHNNNHSFVTRKGNPIYNANAALFRAGFLQLATMNQR
jgi:hypothetical protein